MSRRPQEFKSHQLPFPSQLAVAERILAALREPSDHIIVSAYDELCLQDHENARYSLADAIRAAVAAAEREVGA